MASRCASSGSRARKNGRDRRSKSEIKAGLRNRFTIDPIGRAKAYSRLAGPGICCRRGATQGYNSYPSDSSRVPASMPMLTHNQIWTALDRLAARAKMTPSGLAKKAGLDPTTFNKSKRVTPEGRPRWPSTESVAKALQATSTKFDTFVTLISDGGKATMHSVPLIGFAQAGAGGFFDDGG